MVRPGKLPQPAHSLAGRDGELIIIRITVETCQLERLLEALAETDYHINPTVFPNSPEGARVEFPAYQGWVEPIGATVRRSGLAPSEFAATRMIARLAS